MPARPPPFRPGRGPGSEAARREAEAAVDRRRRAANPARTLYGTARWQRLRAGQLAQEPLCRACLAEDRVTPATVCDHVTPHRGDVALFWRGPFQSLCKPHHDGAKQREEQRGRGRGHPKLPPHPQ